ncbi:MAG: FlgD immunoglobulin-like domain containing protein, partial [bacterium]
NYNELLDWFGIVPNNLVVTNVTIQARLNFDLEPGYDYLYLEVERSSGMDIVQDYTGNNKVADEFVPVDVNETFLVAPEDYVGSGHDQVHLRWHVVSDGLWSDADCDFLSDGAAQVDNITVMFNSIPWTIDDFEPGSWVNWQVSFPTGVGDFAWTWPYLEDIDDCNVNFTPQWAFIDNGLVLPGTGGYPCISWCYGPNGFVVNPEGGLAGPDYHLTNEVWSPSIVWPASGYDGAFFAFDVYRHEPLASASSPGLFYVWHVRSTADPAGNTGWSSWVDRNFVYYGGPDYIRSVNFVTDLLVPGRTHVQLALGVYELGWWWGYTGVDASPGPYFDNVAFGVYEFPGPGISTREIDLAQDNFPEIGSIDPNDPAANHVRFDMAQNIATAGEMINLPGDSICFDITAVRSGSMLNGLPELCYKLSPNPVFDIARTSGLPNAGCVPGDSAYSPSGNPQRDRWCFDLPDTGFFFPGDVIHYYIRAQDNAGGDIATTRMPGDTTGFSLFPGDAEFRSLEFNSAFTVRALPSITDLSTITHPPVLFWNDFGRRGGEGEWFSSFNQIGFREGIEYDVYHTNGPSSGVGNGLGGRASSTQLLGYETILYTCGDLSAFTISNGDFINDPGNDVGVLDGWLGTGGRNLLLTGDDLCYDLNQSGAATIAFLDHWISVNLVSRNLRGVIDNQGVPSVQPIAANPVFFQVAKWLAHGGCPILNTFDAVEPIGVAVSLAEYLEPAPSEGTYPYSAGILNQVDGNDIIYLPYDFMYVSTVNGAADTTKSMKSVGITDRALILKDIMLFFGHTGGGAVVDVPDYGKFSVTNFPNPFNPSTTIQYNMPRRGDLSIKVFNVRGELVRTLLDGIVEPGPGSVVWDGTDHSGKLAASGVYFYETRALGEVTIEKMALVK